MRKLEIIINGESHTWEIAENVSQVEASVIVHEHDCDYQTPFVIGMAYKHEVGTFKQSYTLENEIEL